MVLYGMVSILYEREVLEVHQIVLGSVSCFLQHVFLSLSPLQRLVVDRIALRKESVSVFVATTETFII